MSRRRLLLNYRAISGTRVACPRFFWGSLSKPTAPVSERLVVGQGAFFRRIETKPLPIPQFCTGNNVGGMLSISIFLLA
jgi:hypothetical protein